MDSEFFHPPTERERKQLDARLSTASTHSSSSHHTISTSSHTPTYRLPTEHRPSSSVLAWNTAVVLVVILDSVLVPVRAAFFFDQPFALGIFLLNLLTDLLLWVDLVTRVRHYYQQRKKETSTAALNVPTRRGLVLDVVAIFPLDVLVLLVSSNSTDTHLYRLLRLPRLLTLGRCFRPLVLSLRQTEEFYSITLPGVQRMAKLFFFSIMSSHWAACMFFLTAVVEVVHHGETHTWAHQDGLFAPSDQYQEPLELSSILQQSVAMCYVRSWYWAVSTMITTGLGDIVPTTVAETWVCFACMFLGMVVTAAVVGNLTNIAASMDSSQAVHHRDMHMLNQYMTSRGFPVKRQNTLRNYFAYNWSRCKGFDETQFLDDLPPSLRAQMVHCMSSDALINLPILRACPVSFVNALAVSAELEVFHPGSLLLEKGSDGGCMLVLLKGHAMRVSSLQAPERQSTFHLFNTLRTLTTWRGSDALALEPGQCVNVLEMVAGAPATETIECRTYCEVFSISTVVFHELAAMHLSAALRESIAQQADLGKHAPHRLSVSHSASSSRSSMAPVRQFSRRQRSRRRADTWFRPYSTFRQAWHGLVGACTLFVMFSVPIMLKDIDRSCSALTVGAWLITLSAVVDVVLWVDVYFHSCKLEFTQDGVVVKDRKRIFDRYGRVWFVLDVASCLPLDLIVTASPSLRCWYPLFRLNRVLRGVHLGQLFRDLDTWLDYHNSFRGQSVDISWPLRRALVLTISGLLVVHWMGCLWYLVGSLSLASGTDNWIERDFSAVAGGGWAYVRSVYFILVATTTVGYGDITAYNLSESVFVALCILLCGVAYPAVLGAVASLAVNYDLAKMNYSRHLRTITEYLVRVQAPSDLRHRVTRFYDYMWSRQRGVKEHDVLGKLPRTMRSKVVSALQGQVALRVKLLDGCPSHFKTALLSTMDTVVFLPGDAVLRCGQPVSGMLLVQSGAIISNGRTLSPGACVGFEALLPVLRAVSRAPSLSFSLSVSSSSDARTGSVTTSRSESTTPTLPRPSVDTDDGAMICRSDVSANTYVSALQLSPECLLHTLQRFPECVPTLMANLQSMTADQRHQHAHVHSPRSYPSPSSSSSPVPDAGAERVRGQWRVVEPESVFRWVWDLVSLMHVLYSSFVIPWKAAFLQFAVGGWGDVAGWLAVDYFLDLLWVLDLYFQGNVFAVLRDGVVVSDVHELRKYYSTFAFRLDLVASLPVDLVAVLAGGSVSLVALLRLVRLLRLHHVMEYFKSVREFSGVRLSPSAVRLMQLCSGVLLLCHWFACGFFAVHVLQETVLGEGAVTWVDDQLTQGYLVAPAAIMSQYLRAMYWALATILVVVIGDVTPVTNTETLYIVFVILLGVSVNAAIIGIIVEIIASTEDTKTLFSLRADTVDEHMKALQLSPGVQGAVRQHYDYLWLSRRGVSAEGVVEELPVSLRRELYFVLRQPLLARAAFFRRCDQELSRTLAMLFRSLVVPEGDYIIRQGEVGTAMYFHRSGRAQVLLPLTSPLAHTRRGQHRLLRKECFFGEMSCFRREPRTVSIKALEYCELYVLTLAQVDTLLANYGLPSIHSSRDTDNCYPHGMASVVEAIRRVRDDLVDAVPSPIPPFSPSPPPMSGHIHVDVEEHATSLEMQSLSRDTGVTPVRRHAHTNVLSEGVSGAVRVEDAFVEEYDGVSSTPAPVPQPQPLHFHSNARLAWDIVALVVSVYYTVAAPVRLALWVDTGVGRLAWVSLGVAWCADLFFLVDMYARATWFPLRVSSAREANGTVGKEVIWRDYVGGRFVADALVSFPYEVIMFLVCAMTGRSVTLLRVCLCRLPKMLSVVVRIPRLLHNTELRLKGKTSLRMDLTWLRICKMALLYLLVVHWYGCVWLSMYWHLERDDAQTWFEIDDMSAATPLGWQYCRGVYFAVTTLSSIGFGDIRPANDLETVFEVVVTCTGACMFAVLIGLFAARFSHRDSRMGSSQAYHTRMLSLMRYMEYRSFPSELRHALVRHHAMLWRQEQENNALYIRELPLSLRMAIASEVHAPLVHSCVLLQCAPKTLRLRVLEKLRSRLLQPAEQLYQSGDLGSEVYFVSAGCVLVTAESLQDVSKEQHGRRPSLSHATTKTQTHASAVTYTRAMRLHSWLRASGEGSSESRRTCGPGSFFGHDDLDKDGFRTQSAVAVDPCELLAIALADLHQIAAELGEHMSQLYLILTNYAHIRHARHHSLSHSSLSDDDGQSLSSSLPRRASISTRLSPLPSNAATALTPSPSFSPEPALFHNPSGSFAQKRPPVTTSLLPRSSLSRALRRSRSVSRSRDEKKV